MFISERGLECHCLVENLVDAVPNSIQDTLVRSSKIQSPVTQSSGPVPTGYHTLPPHQPFLLFVSSKISTCLIQYRWSSIHALHLSTIDYRYTLSYTLP